MIILTYGIIRRIMVICWWTWEAGWQAGQTVNIIIQRKTPVCRVAGLTDMSGVVEDWPMNHAVSYGLTVWAGSGVVVIVWHSGSSSDKICLDGL